MEDSNTPEIIHFLLDTEMFPLCLRCIEVGSELSKTVYINLNFTSGQNKSTFSKTYLIFPFFLLVNTIYIKIDLETYCIKVHFGRLSTCLTHFYQIKNAGCSLCA